MTKTFTCSMQKKKESFAKKSEGVEALKDKVVSDGTLKPEDLIPKFLNALKHDETAHSKFLKDNPEILEIQSWDDVDDETKSMLVDELTDALNDIAPDGYFFGASDGDGACFGFWKVDPDESKQPEAKTCEATFKQGVDDFISCAPSGGWSDYWAMQQDWEMFKDGLCRDGRITQRQADSWGNPCTPETFNRWQKRNGLTRRGGWDESKKSEAAEDALVSKATDYIMRNAKRANVSISITPIDNTKDYVGFEIDGVTVHGLPAYISVYFNRDDGSVNNLAFFNNDLTLNKGSDVDILVDAPIFEKDPARVFNEFLSQADSANESKKSEDASYRGEPLSKVKRAMDSAMKKAGFKFKRELGIGTRLFDKGGNIYGYHLQGQSGDPGYFDYVVVQVGEPGWGKVERDHFDSVEKAVAWLSAKANGGSTKESKQSEGVGGKIKMGIDYNMFMRMCASAAYLDENEDYWDALWEYYSEMGEIEDACEFFDNLFQYTSWCDEDEVYDEYLDDSYKDGTKSKAECIEAAVDAGDLDVFKTDKGYLVIQ